MVSSIIRSKHSNAPRRYIKSQYQAQCPYCEKQFVTNVALTNHIILKHENSAQFQCDICHGKYPSENKLRVHIGKGMSFEESAIFL